MGSDNITISDQAIIQFAKISECKTLRRTTKTLKKLVKVAVPVEGEDYLDANGWLLTIKDGVLTDVKLKNMLPKKRLFRKERKSDSVIISPHAIDKFMERSGSKNRTRAVKTIRKLIDNAEYVEIKDNFRVIQLLNHHCTKTVYKNAHGWILVFVDDTLITIHRGEAKRWKAPEESHEPEMQPVWF